MDINDRVKLFMDFKKLSSGEFAEITRIQPSTLSHFINGRNKASLDIIMKIRNAFPELNIDWVLYEEGEMLSVNTPDSNANVDLFSENNDVHNCKQGLNQPVTPNSPASQAELVAALQLTNQRTVVPPKPQRKIIEIRVFYDDNTFETFQTR